MITLTERDIAVDLIDYRLIDVLCDWITRERRNLDSYILNPEGHINHNPYIIPDLNALQQRSNVLGVVTHSLTIISGHKKGENYTRTQHDEAVEDIPYIILSRLDEWMEKRIYDMEKIYNEYNLMAPNKEYIGLTTFNSVKFLEELAMYKDSLRGLEVLIEYKKQQQVSPTEKETAGGDLFTNSI